MCNPGPSYDGLCKAFGLHHMKSLNAVEREAQIVRKRRSRTRVAERQLRVLSDRSLLGNVVQIGPARQGKELEAYPLHCLGPWCALISARCSVAPWISMVARWSVARRCGAHVFLLCLRCASADC